MKQLDKEIMSNALIKVISLCGIDVLADAARFQAAIRDFLYSNSVVTEQQLLIFLVRIGIGAKLLTAIDKSDMEQKRMLTVSYNLLTLEYGFQSERSENLLSVVASALGWQGLLVHTTIESLKEHRREIAEAKPSSSFFVKGTTILFGKYNWRVLFVKGTAAMLITDEITDIGIPYDSTVNLEGVSWEDCSLRKWLNNEFLKRFSVEQRSRIIRRTVRTKSNPWFHTDAGNPTNDRIFLLSVSEVVRGFGDSGYLQTGLKDSWAYKSGGLSYTIDDKYNAARQAAYKGDKTWWWLRSPGESRSKVAYVNAAGIICLNGETVFDNGGTSCVGVRPGVRPAIWLHQ